MTLIYVSVAWVASIYVASRLPAPWALPLALLLAIVPLLVLARHNTRLLLSGVCMAVFLGGMLRVSASLPGQEAHDLVSYNSQAVTLRGLVADEPEPHGSMIQVRLAAREIDSGDGLKQVNGAVLLYVPRLPAYRYGDMLEVRGTLKPPPTSKDFDYAAYLARHGIGSVMSYPQITLVAHDKGSPALIWLNGVRAALSRSLAAALPEPQAALAQGMLLGLRNELPPSLTDALYRSGTSHLIAISGMNIAIVAGLFLAAGAWVFGRRRPTYILLALAAAWIYTLLAGLPASAVRAAIMASLFLLALWLGRQRSAATALAFAAAVMVGVSPNVLWDVGFQLSVLAMAGLVFITPRLQSGQRGVVGVLIDGLAYSAGPVLATLPLLAYNFHRISSVSLPATLLAVPAMAGLIVTSAATALAGLVSLPLAHAVGFTAWPFLAYTVKVVELFAALPGSLFGVSHFNGLLVVAYFAVLALCLWPKPAIRRLVAVTASVRDTLTGVRVRPQVVAPLVAVAVVIWWAALFSMPADSRLKVSFLDVGQGDAALIQVGRRQVLVDGGPDPQRLALELGRRLPFWDRDIDLVVLTHPHEDHLGGLVEALRRYRVQQVLEVPRPDGVSQSGTSKEENPYDSATYKTWDAQLNEQRTKRYVAEAGWRIDLGGGVALTVLHPATEGASGLSIDDSAVVLRLEKGNVSFLLTGDTGQAAEARLLAGPSELTSTVLKVAHHGSDTSTSEAFLAAVRPQVAVISVGENNRFGHPNGAVIGRLGDTKLYRTDERGSLDFTTDGTRMWVKTER